MALHFHPVDTRLFFTRNDPRDPRLGDLVDRTGASNTPFQWRLAGYSDDEGISLNGGRIGAAHGPDSIRKYFYKMTPSVLRPEPLYFTDLGNLSTELPLAERHERARETVKETLSHGERWFSWGGGHDYGYADGAGFLDVYSQSAQRPLILNFDAHLDVRPTDRGFTSGTPFYRLLENDQWNFDFAEIGIQSQCNSRAHWDWALSKGTRILSFDEILLSGVSQSVAIGEFLEPYLARRRPVFLSIDIDAFQSPASFGSSQNFPQGLDPHEFFKILEVLKARCDLRAVGIYEVSPPLDHDGLTSRLAALITHRVLF